MICFPPAAIVNERYIHVGAYTMIGPHVTLSAGMVPGQACLTDPVVRIGDRCLLGQRERRSSAISRSRSRTTCGPATTCTSPTRTTATPISTCRSGARRCPSVRCVSAPGRGSATARSSCPGATIGRHVVIGANSVVRGDIPAYCVAAGNPARVVKTD